MKKFKNIVFISLFFVFICLGAVFFAPKAKDETFAEQNKYAFSDFINFFPSSAISNIKSSNNYNYSIISNDAVTIKLNAFKYKFNIEATAENSNEEFFNNSTIKTASFSIDSDDSESSDSFEFNFLGEKSTYYFVIVANKLNIYSSKSHNNLIVGNIDQNSLLSCGIKFNPTTKVVTYISSIIYNFPLDEASFTFFINTNRTPYVFSFVKPITKFTNLNNPIVLFECHGIDAGYSYKPTWLPSEHTYKTVKIKFFINYTETNPLFFNVNYNGFIYNYQIFTQGENLILKYFDDSNGNGTIESDEIVTKTYEIFDGALSKTNTFDMEFKDIGRYEVEFFDSTFNQVLSVSENRNLNANYYQTSFYIYDDSKTYENVYMVGESLENGEHKDYIISNSGNQTVILNTDIRATFKNLHYLSREDFEKIQIIVTKTLFTGSILSQYTYYTYENEKMLYAYENSQDFYIDFTDDARYMVTAIYGNGDSSILLLTSIYEVVKLPKTLFEIGNPGDPYYESYIENRPYTKTEKSYVVPLTSQIVQNFSYKNELEETVIIDSSSSTFNKVHLNKFKIFYGISQVNISRYTRMISNGSESSPAITLDIKILAVGRTNVEAYLNGELVYSTTFAENENKVLSFSEYGTYTIKVVDEMGTTKTATFNYSKQLNTSAILLIVLSGILILGIAIFIIRARTKVATR